MRPPPPWRAVDRSSTHCDRRADRSPSRRRPRPDAQVVGVDAGPPARRPPARRGWRRRRGRRRRVDTAGSATGRLHAAGDGPRLARSRNSRPARRRASSRSFWSVAPVRSASSASVASGSSSSADSTASSSSSPTSGEISSKCGCCSSARRDVVLRRALVTSSSAASPSLAGGGEFSGRRRPGRGVSLSLVRPVVVLPAEHLDPQFAHDVLGRAGAALLAAGSDPTAPRGRHRATRRRPSPLTHEQRPATSPPHTCRSRRAPTTRPAGRRASRVRRTRSTTLATQSGSRPPPPAAAR